MSTLRIAMEFLWIGSLAVLLGAVLLSKRFPKGASHSNEWWAFPAGLVLLLAGGMAGLAAAPTGGVFHAASLASFGRTAGLLVLVYAAWGWMKQFDRLAGDRVRLGETNQALAEKVESLQLLESQQEAILTGIKNVGIEFLDTEMRMIWANTKSLGQTGNLSRDIDGRRCYEIRRGLDAPCPDCQTVAVLQSGEYREGEMHKDDGRIYFVQSNPVRDKNGKLIGVLNADTDITDRKAAERALRRSEEKYRTLVETVSEAIYEVDANGTIIYISTGVIKIMGFQPEEIVGKSFIDFVYPEDRRRLIERFAELRADITRPSEYRLINKEGEPRWVETFSQPRFEDDRFVGLVGVMTDIHQRKLLEVETDYQKQLLGATLNATADGIIAADHQERILTWNRRFEEMWQLTSEQLKGMQAIQELSAAIAKRFPQADPTAAGLFAMPADETKHEIAMGDRVFEVVSLPLSSNDRTTGQVWNVRDITQARAAKAALSRSEEKFSKLFNANPIWSELVSLEDGRFIEVNQAFLDTTGFAHQEVIGRTSIELGLWPDAGERASVVAHFRHNNRLDSMPCRFRMHDGQTRHFLWSAESVELEGTRCLISSLRDVTEQHHMERALRQSEERYRSLYENIPVGLFRTTPEGRILSANPALVKLFGYDLQDDFMAMPSADFYASSEVRGRLIAQLEKDGAATMDAIEFRRRDGSTFWASLSAVKVADGDGQFRYLDGEIKDVSKRVQAEQALRASEEKYRLVVDNAHDGIFIARDGQMQFSNPSTCRILGYDHEELMAMPFEKVVHPDDAAMVMGRHLARLSGDDPPNHYTFRAFRKSGETLYLELEAVRVGWEGQPAVLCIVRDITARKKAEIKLIEEKRFSETVINSLPGFFYLFEEDGRLRRWNRNLEKVTDMSPEQLGQMRMLDWFAPGDQRMAASAFLEVLEKGEGDAEMPVLTPSGRKRPFYFRACKLDVEGRTYILGAALDISKHKKLETALRESEKRFRHLVEKMPFGICIAVAGAIVYRNSTQERLLGPLDQCVKLADAPLPAEDLKRYLAACDFAARTGRPVDDLELQFYPQGKPRDPHHLVWMHCSINPIDYRGQKALLIAMLDLTRMKELEHQVLIREKMASLGHVAAGIAHEIRNPLSGINVLLEGIRENFQDPDSAEDIRVLLDETQKASDKIARVIRRVLDFSKPSPVKMQRHHISAPVEEAVQLTQVTLRKKDIALDLQLDNDLPHLYIDHQLIEQVMLNLINNAAAAVDAHSGDKRILITSQRENEHIAVHVADSGHGIAETLKAKIFNPFFTTGSDGSGIGLSLCQRIASDHGGTIEVGQSKLGGAEFRLRLPIEKRRYPR